MMKVSEAEWRTRAKNLLKSELKREGVSYSQLAERLEAMGISESDKNIANKLSRGGFSAVFLLQVMEALGQDTLRLR